MKKLIYILPMLMLLTSCGNSFRVYHDLDPTAGFDQYETYAFLDWTDGNKKTITGMELERIRKAFARELEKKGLAYDPENADVQVQITVYFREKKEIYGFYYPQAYNYLERALAVDFFEGTSKKHIWHSAAVGQVESSPKERAEALPGQVAKMLAKYPAG